MGHHFYGLLDHHILGTRVSLDLMHSKHFLDDHRDFTFVFPWMEGEHKQLYSRY